MELLANWQLPLLVIIAIAEALNRLFVLPKYSLEVAAADVIVGVNW